METKKSELKKKVKEWLEFQEGYNIECLLENQDFAACLIECMVEFVLKQTTSQQQTIERLREGLKSGIETMDYLLNELPKDDIISRHEVKSRKSQFEQLLNTTEPIDQ